MLLALIVLVYAGFGLGIEGYLSPYALADSTYNFSEKGLIALAMALLIVAGEIDLSIAARWHCARWQWASRCAPVRRCR